MHLCTVRGVEIRFSPLLLLAVAVCCVLGRLERLLQALLALTLHETAHVIVAAAFEQKVFSLELQPFGCVARMRSDSLEPHTELCIAVAGPVMSFIAAGAVTAIAGMLPRTAFRLDAFVTFNMTLAFVNLLPALPLDGGRMVRALLAKRMGRRRATRLTAWTGVAAGMLMLLAAGVLMTFKIVNLTLVMMGLFLCAAAVRALKTEPDCRMGEVLRRGGALDGGEAVPVQAFAVRPAMRAREALKIMQGNRFHVLRVMGPDNRLVGELDEAQIVCAIAREGLAVTLGDILAFDRR